MKASIIGVINMIMPMASILLSQLILSSRTNRHRLGAVKEKEKRRESLCSSSPSPLFTSFLVLPWLEPGAGLGCAGHQFDLVPWDYAFFGHAGPSYRHDGDYGDSSSPSHTLALLTPTHRHGVPLETK